MDAAEATAVPPRDYDGFIDETGGDHDGKMGAPVESDWFIFSNGDVGRHVDEVAEDLACLGIVVAAHAARHQAIEPGGEDEKGHVEVDLETDRRGECVAIGCLPKLILKPLVRLIKSGGQGHPPDQLFNP